MAAKLTTLTHSDTTAPNGRELYHLQFSLQAASPETFGYTLVSGAWMGVSAYKLIRRHDGEVPYHQNDEMKSRL
jgi:hypothetical protein